MFRAGSFEEDQEISIFNAIQLASQSHDKELIYFLVNPHVLAILSITARKGMTVNDVSRALELPLATCYKLVERMVELGLMARIGTTRTSSRGRAANYTSSLRSMSVSMSEGHLEASVVWKNGQVEDFRMDFQSCVPEQETVTRSLHHRTPYPRNPEI
jgi:DNA-binding MarR family transcriptional regulator